MVCHGLFHSPAISIHASHAGCDMKRWQNSVKTIISIHASHAGCDVCLADTHAATVRISIHASHAGCDKEFVDGHTTQYISIHASHAGCDPSLRLVWVNPEIFQSTHPMRDATMALNAGSSPCRFQYTHPMRDATESSTIRRPNPFISIHASHAGCDVSIHFS